MQFALQVGTGGFNHKTVDYIQIEKRLKLCFESLDATSVLIGWTIDKDLYSRVYKLVKEYGKEVYLWLPVFAEISDIVKTSPAIDFMGQPMKPINVADGENFNFVCPSSTFNINQIRHIFNEYFDKTHFDGVFLDKIRYASFGNGFNAAVGCFCDNCCAIYERNDIDVEKLKKTLHSQNRQYLMPTRFENCRYEFSDPAINHFYKLKSNIILDSVAKLCDYFRAMGLKVGLDVFAPIASYLVGQDILELSRYADFIKPMMYRCSGDPAGIRYEYRNMIEQMGNDETEKYNQHFLKLFNTDNVLSDEFLALQMNMMKGAACDISQGIEINKNEKMPDSSEHYVTNSVKIARDQGFENVVLSWDVVTAPQNHIECLRQGSF